PAANLGLNNLTILYDDNRSHSRGLQIPNAAERFRAFGCDVAETPGHDVDAMRDAISARDGKPRVVVARTVKGFGCATLADNAYEWHRKSPNDLEYRLLLRELDA
ncbi:MAG: transketolase, partial [Actinobacteria bacterium]|nr:transketolase [Actinomycetota bacterium]